MDACAITHGEPDLEVRWPNRGGARQMPVAWMEARRADAPAPADPPATVPGLRGVALGGGLPSHPADGDFGAFLTDLTRASGLTDAHEQDAR